MEEWQQAPAADTGALFEAIARQQMRIAVENVPWEEEEEENERDRKKKKKKGHFRLFFTASAVCFLSLTA